MKSPSYRGGCSSLGETELTLCVLFYLTIHFMFLMHLSLFLFSMYHLYVLLACMSIHGLPTPHIHHLCTHPVGSGGPALAGSL